MGILFAVIPIIGGINYVCYYTCYRKGRAVIYYKRKFINLGTLQGKTYNEIVAVVGSPNSVSSSAGRGKDLSMAANRLSYIIII